MERLPILIIEDDPDMQFLIQAVFKADPRLRPISTTRNALEAIALTMKEAPTLVLLDHVIEGGIMGLQVAPMLKAIAPKIKIILFTTQDFSFEASQEPAIDLYLPKKHLRKLLPAVQRLIGLEPLG